MFVSGPVCFPDDSAVKNLPAKAGDLGSIFGSRKAPQGGNGNSLQDSCLENFMGRGDWQTTVHGILKKYPPKVSHLVSPCLFLS